MKKNSILLQANTSLSNTSAIVRVHKYRDGFFYPVYGWTIGNLSTDASNKIEIDLDKNNIFNTIRALQDTLPFGITISVECPIGTEAMWMSDLYHTDMIKCLEIVQNNNLDTSINAITDLRIEGNTIIASFRGNYDGEFELYEISNGGDIATANIIQRYSTNVAKTSTRLDITLDHAPSDDNKVLARWRTIGEKLFSTYIMARKAHNTKSLTIERHEIVGGNLVLYLYDNDTLGAFQETGLIIRVKAGTENFIVSAMLNNTANRTMTVISGTELDRIIALNSVVQLSAELIGGSITSNTYNLDTNSIIPTPPAPGTVANTSVKYLGLNADKIVVDTDNKRIFFNFDVSPDAVVEKLVIDNISNVTLDKTSYNLTDRQLNAKPSFGFWAKYSGSGDIWASNIRYTYRLKDTVEKTAVVELSPELPKIDFTIQIVRGAYEMRIPNIKCTYDVIRGANQTFKFQDVTFYDERNSALARVNNILTLNENGMVELYGDQTLTMAFQNTAKIGYKYSFAGKPYSAEIIWEDTNNILKNMYN